MLFPRLALRALVGMLLLVLGAGAVPARAADYPLPTHGQGQVDRSRVHAGECVFFSGDGFKPGTPLTISDDGQVVGHTQADAHGKFRTKVCFATDARLGRHVLMAEGIGANGAARDVTATVTVVGVSTTRPPPGGSTGGSTGNSTSGGNGTGGGNSTGQGTGGGTGHSTGGNGTGGSGSGNGTGGPTTPPGSIGTTGGDTTTTGATGPGSTTGSTDLGHNGGIGKLAMYGGLIGLFVLLLILYLLWRDRRDRNERQLSGLVT